MNITSNKEELTMKKTMSVILALIMTFSLAACGAKAPSSGANSAPSTPAASAPADKAADPIVVKLGFAESESSTHYKGYKYLCDKVTEATEGLVTFELYPSNSLGNERDLYEGCQLGIQEACIVTNATLTNFVPEAAVLDQPFLFDNFDQAWEFIDGPFGDFLETKAEAGGVKIVGWMDSGFRSVFTNFPVSSIADLKGAKIRTMENEYHMAAYNALGCIATPMAFGDVYPGLQQGTIDGAENTIPSLMANNFYEVCKYICNQPVLFAYQLLVFSDDLWNKIPAEYHDAVLAAIAEGCQYQRELLRDSEEGFKEELVKDHGVTFFDLPLDELKSLTREAMKQFKFDEETLALMNEELAKLS